MRRVEIVDGSYRTVFGRLVMTREEFGSYYEMAFENGKHSAMTTASRLRKQLNEALLKIKELEGNIHDNQTSEEEDSATVESSVPEASHQGERQDGEGVVSVERQLP